MLGVRLYREGLVVEELDVPRPRTGEALVRVHAAAITRELRGRSTGSRDPVVRALRGRRGGRARRA